MTLPTAFLRTAIICLSFFAQTTLADFGCTGPVRVVMEWPDHCDGRLAYMADANNSKWVCTLSQRSESMVLAAVASGLKLTTVFPDSVNATCATLDTHYLSPRYIMVRNDQ